MSNIGRPSKYKQVYCEEFLEYFSIDPTRLVTRKVPTKNGVAEVDVEVLNDFPTLAGFAIKIGVHRDTLLEWANATNEDGSLKYPEFSGVYKRAKDYQENFLVTAGLSGVANTSFAIFTAKNLINWRNQTDVNLDAKVSASVDNSTKELDLDERVKQLEKAKDSALQESDTPTGE